MIVRILALTIYNIFTSCLASETDFSCKVVVEDICFESCPSSYIQQQKTCIQTDPMFIKLSFYETGGDYNTLSTPTTQVVPSSKTPFLPSSKTPFLSSSKTPFLSSFETSFLSPLKTPFFSKQKIKSPFFLNQQGLFFSKHTIKTWRRNLFVWAEGDPCFMIYQLWKW